MRMDNVGMTGFDACLNRQTYKARHKIVVVVVLHLPLCLCHSMISIRTRESSCFSLSPMFCLNYFVVNEICSSSNTNYPLIEQRLLSIEDKLHNRCLRKNTCSSEIDWCTKTSNWFDICSKEHKSIESSPTEKQDNMKRQCLFAMIGLFEIEN